MPRMYTNCVQRRGAGYHDRAMQVHTPIDHADSRSLYDLWCTFIREMTNAPRVPARMPRHISASIRTVRRTAHSPDRGTLLRRVLAFSSPRTGVCARTVPTSRTILRIPPRPQGVRLASCTTTRALHYTSLDASSCAALLLGR